MSLFIARALPVLLATFIAAPAAEAKPAKKAKAKTETTVLKIENLSKKDTTRVKAKRLKRALKKLKGVTSAKVDRGKGTVMVKYRGADTLGRVEMTLMKQGFKIARPKKAEPVAPPPAEDPDDDYEYDPGDDDEGGADDY